MLLTSVICRYIIDSRKLEHKKRRLMVCAPTNKAVTVLCDRFLTTFSDDEAYPCNAVLLGDEDKLLENEMRARGNATLRNSKLRDSFLYTFVDAIKDDYLFVRKVLDKANFNLLDRIQKIVRRLKNLLTQKVSDNNVVANAHGIAKLIQKFSKSRDMRYPTEIINKIDLIVSMISAWNREFIWQEVLNSADVIFCTLGSSGSSLLKKTISEIDDLIVDEAAAATEPEIYIPFQYLPRRLLCVGDPKQLPATITSQYAEKMGLSKSLHERLMYDCDHDHIMLDTQYRMKPALSEFPSNNFYGGRLRNGRNVFSSHKTSWTSVVGRTDYTLYQIYGKEEQNRSGSIENRAEANAVVQIVDDFRHASRNLSSDWCSINRLRIITFYQAQVCLIKRLLRSRNLGNVLVATVDSSQGCEADFVIISFVRSINRPGRSTVGFLSDDRRLNVALTRAKYQLICVGNIEGMAKLSDSKGGSMKHLAIDAFNRRLVYPFSFKGESSCKTLSDNKSESFVINEAGHLSIRGNPKKISITSSSSESDSESSVISSSSSSSDSSSSDSSQAASCKQRCQINAAMSTTERSNSSSFRATMLSNCHQSNVENNFSSTKEVFPTSQHRKLCKSFNQPILMSQTKSLDKEQTAAVGSKMTEATTFKILETTAPNSRPRTEDGIEANPNYRLPEDSKCTHSSILSKTETSSVFENIIF